MGGWFPGTPFWLSIIGIAGLLEQVANGAAQEVAEPVKVLKADGLGLVRDHAVEVLVAQVHLLEEPVFGVVLFFQDFQYA